MHTGQSRVISVQRGRFSAASGQSCRFAFYCAIALSLLQGCGGGSSGSSGPPPLTVSTTSVPGGTVTVSYSATLSAAGGSGAGYVWAVSSGTPPGGLTLSSGGVLSGIPTAAGTFSFTVTVTDSSGATASANLGVVIAAAGPLTNYEFTGDTSPVHDPSIIRQGSTYYLFSTDASSTQGGFIPIRCSTDKIAWSACGYVFSTLPAWVSGAVPQATQIWAPDVSYFNDSYHVYYAVSSLDRMSRRSDLLPIPHWIRPIPITVGSIRASFCNPPLPTTSTPLIPTS